MKNYLLFIMSLVLVFSGFSVNAQLKVGNNPNTIGASSILELESPNKGLVVSRVANTAAITAPVNGMIIYDMSSNCIKFYENNAWSNCISIGSNGSVAAINCGGATNNGTLTSGVAASGVNSIINYTGGNSGTYSRQDVTSTGVTGLTASLAPGTFTNGAGTLTFNITGTPASSGTASFAFNIGGQSCVFTRTVNLPAGTITSIDCAGATNNGTLTSGEAASGVNSVISYTGGNGGANSGQIVTSTGVTGLTATLAPGTLANGAGTLTYTISGTPTGSGTASFALNIGGQSCILTRTVSLPIGSIAGFNCAGATNNGILTSGEAASGVNSVISYTGGNGGTHSGQVVNSTGVTGLTATLAASTFANGAGTLTYTISGTPTGSGTASFALDIGGQSCILTRTVNLPAGSISSLNCGGATNSGTLTLDVAASGVTSVISYTGGNGRSHPGQVVSSSGVTGLTATLAAGTFANGAGTLTYTITGTPNNSGTASFVINIGGQNCTLVRNVICNSNTTVVEVTFGGRIWMDRNLGANRVAQSPDDAQAYGHFWQWGRGSDGHQCVHRYSGDRVTTSATTTILSNTDNPGHAEFIIDGRGEPDWRSTRNDNLWQGVNGINNPCPTGFRLPTGFEVRDMFMLINSEEDRVNGIDRSFDSPLKIPSAGRRRASDGSLQNVGLQGLTRFTSVSLWSSTPIFPITSTISTSPQILTWNPFHSIGVSRGSGMSVRCIKD